MQTEDATAPANDDLDAAKVQAEGPTDAAPAAGRQRRKNPVNIDAPDKFMALCTLTGEDPAALAQAVLGHYAEAWGHTFSRRPSGAIIACVAQGED